jgi:hypothetical protein
MLKRSYFALAFAAFVVSFCLLFFHQRPMLLVLSSALLGISLVQIIVARRSRREVKH